MSNNINPEHGGNFVYTEEATGSTPVSPTGISKASSQICEVLYRHLGAA